MLKKNTVDPFEECEAFVEAIEKNSSVLHAVFGVGENGSPRFAQHVLADRLVDAIETACSARSKLPYSMDVEAWRELPEMQKTLDVLHRFLLCVYVDPPVKDVTGVQSDGSTTFYGRIADLSDTLTDFLPEVPIVEALADHLFDAGRGDAVSQSLYYSVCLSMYNQREGKEELIQSALIDLASDNPSVLMGTLDVLTDIQRFADAYDGHHYAPKTHYKPLGRYTEFLKAANALTTHQNGDVADIAKEAVVHLEESHARSLDELTENLGSGKAQREVRRALMAVRSITTPSAG